MLSASFRNVTSGLSFFGVGKFSSFRYQNLNLMAAAIEEPDAVYFFGYSKVLTNLWLQTNKSKCITQNCNVFKDNKSPIKIKGAQKTGKPKTVTNCRFCLLACALDQWVKLGRAW